MVEAVVSQGGLNFGDTFIGMHEKHIQVLIYPTFKESGSACVTALHSCLKYMGGPCASYLN